MYTQSFVVINEKGVMSRHRSRAAADHACGRVQASCRVVREAVGRVKRVVNGWQAWVFDAIGATDWGIYDTRQEARDAARRGANRANAWGSHTTPTSWRNTQ